MRLGGRKEGHSVCKTRLFSFASTPAKGRIMKDVKRTHIKILLLDWKCQYSSLQCIFYITKSTKKPWITYFNYRYIYTCLPWPNKKSISLFFRYLPICQVHYFLWEYCYQKTVQCHNISSVIRQEDESQNQNNKKTKHVKCFEKQVFLTFDTLIMGGVGDVCFLESLVGFVFLLPPFWDSPFHLITDDLRQNLTKRISKDPGGRKNSKSQYYSLYVISMTASCQKQEVKL